MTNPTDYTPLETATAELEIARHKWLEEFCNPPYRPNLQTDEEYYRASERWLDCCLDELSRRSEERRGR